MKRFDELSIRSKLILLVITVAIIIIVPVSGARLAWDYKQSKHLLLQEVSTLGRLLADRSNAALAFGDTRLAQENLNSLNSFPHIKLACVYKNDGSLFVAHQKDDIQCDNSIARLNSTFSKSADQQEEVSWFNENSLNVIAPIRHDDNNLGIIYIVSDLSLLYLRLREQLGFSAFALLVAVLISGALTGWVRRLIAGPVETLLVKYRSLFDYANDVIMLTDVETGQIIDTNPAACRLYGYGIEELLGMTVFQLSAPQVLPGIPKYMEQVREKGEAVFERVHFSKDGRQIPVEVSSRIIEIGHRPALLSIIRNLTERKKVEYALAESERRFRALVEQSPISTQILTPDGFTRMVNPAWEKFWNNKGEALANYNILNDVQLLKAGTLPYIKLGFAGKATDIPPIAYNPAENTDVPGGVAIHDRWVRGFIYPIKDAAGKVTEVILTHEDVTEKKQTEEAIKNIAAGVSAQTGSAFFEQLALYLSKLFTTKYVLIGLIDESDTITINTLALSINGTIGKNISYKLTNTPSEVVIKEGTYSLPTGVKKFFSKDKLLTELAVDSFIGTPLFNTAGQPLGLIALLDDKPLTRTELMSEILQIFSARAGAELVRLRAEKDLSIKERAMEVAIEGIILLDVNENNTIIYANHAMELITGYSREELAGKNINLLHATKSDPVTVVQLRDSILRRKPCKVEILNCRKDGREFWNEITLTPVSNELDEVTHFIGTYVDITERRHADDALRRSQKMEAVGQLAGGVAHDFNNQLGIIIGYLDFLRDRVSGEEKPSQWVKTATQATKRCIELTRQLLAFSRRKAKETVTTNLNDELIKMDKLIARAITPAITVHSFQGDDLWLVDIDQGEFQDVILNLVINARDAMPDGGSLIIETSNSSLDTLIQSQTPNLKSGDYVQLMVSDTGTGMNKETLERVFEPFFTTKPEGRGTGLGLSMVYGFAHRYGGDIKIYSEPGEGTTIRIYLPRSQLSIPKKHYYSSEFTELPRGRETVLIVDDESDLLSLAEDYLKSLGYRIYIADCAEMALKQLRFHPEIDLLFSDVVMPGGINGFELAAQAVSLKPNLRVLLTSGFTAKAIDVNSHARFHSNLLQKPYQKDELARQIRTVLDSPVEPIAGRVTQPESAINSHTAELTKPPSIKHNQLEGHTILVIDDDENVRDLYKLNLSRLGCKTFLAADGGEGIALYQHAMQAHEAIDAIIVDLSIPGEFDGKEIANKIHIIDPSAKLIVSSGDSEGQEMNNYKDYGFIAALHKTFNRDTIEKLLIKVINADS